MIIFVLVFSEMAISQFNLSHWFQGEEGLCYLGSHLLLLALNDSTRITLSLN